MVQVLGATQRIKVLHIHLAERKTYLKLINQIKSAELIQQVL